MRVKVKKMMMMRMNDCLHIYVARSIIYTYAYIYGYLYIYMTLVQLNAVLQSVDVLGHSGIEKKEEYPL